MKGLLSFLGITLITVAFGLILLLFYGHPLEKLKAEERQLAYQEMRANHSAVAVDFTSSKSILNDHADSFSVESEQSCSRLYFNK